MEPAANGTDQRLDAILDELRAIRASLPPSAPPAAPEGTVELREPSRERPGPDQRKRRP